MSRRRQVGPSASFRDTDEEQREPAEQDVGADAGLEPMEDRAQLQGGLHVAETPFGLEQVLVAQRDVLGGQVGVGGGEQVLPVEAFLGGDLGPVDHEPARGPLP